MATKLSDSVNSGGKTLGNTALFKVSSVTRSLPVLVTDAGAYLQSGTILKGTAMDPYPDAKDVLKRAFIEEDPITWNNDVVTTPIKANVRNIKYLNGLYLSFGASGNTMATSPDGITWSSRTIGINVTDVEYAVGLFVAVGDSGGVATSPDGITWTTRAAFSSPTYKNLTSICYGNGVFVAVGQNCTLVTSVDGITWFSGVGGTGTATPAFTAVEFIAGNFIAVATNEYETNTIFMSKDGSVWLPNTTLGSVSVYSGAPTNIVAGNGRILILGHMSNLIYSDDNGVTWKSTALNSIMRSLRISSVAYINGAFVAAYNTNGSTSIYLAMSYDGITWKVIPVPTGMIGFSPYFQPASVVRDGLVEFFTQAVTTSGGSTYINRRLRPNLYQGIGSPVKTSFNTDVIEYIKIK